jgi:hypothetical protein|tara:strand:- start:1076 stop:1396 length:321 start_codon:yes stop_codon:yes gene_type:complete
MENIGSVRVMPDESDLATLFDTDDGNNTYTDSELHQLLGFVESTSNATSAADRASLDLFNAASALLQTVISSVRINFARVPTTGMASESDPSLIPTLRCGTQSLEV